MLILLILLSGIVRGADTGATVSDRITLADGTELLGAIESETLEFASSLGALQPKTKDLRGFADGRLSLRDGTEVKGAFVGPPVNVRTALGVMEIPADQIVAITRSRPNDQSVGETPSIPTAAPAVPVAPPRPDELTPPVFSLADASFRYELSGLDHYDGYNAVVHDGAGGFVIVGAVDGKQSGEGAARFRHIGSDGNAIADQTFVPEGATAAVLVDVIRLADGEFVAAGYSRPQGANADDCWVARLTAAGHERWSRSLGGSAHERCYFAALLYDGDVLVGGRSEEDASGKKSAEGAVWRLDQPLASRDKVAKLPFAPKEPGGAPFRTVLVLRTALSRSSAGLPIQSAVMMTFGSSDATPTAALFGNAAPAETAPILPPPCWRLTTEAR
ncbi:MAG: hypothetical protein IPM60_15770 [Rhodospirillales bacterium]|nr:hypothetical protein [Rhodospirillales bacterium]